jgi:hypothetical protein
MVTDCEACTKQVCGALLTNVHMLHSHGAR